MSLNIVIPPETGGEQFEWDSSEKSGWTPSFRKEEIPADPVSKYTLLSLLEKRHDPDSLDSAGSLLGRHVHMFRQSGPVTLTVFAGEHEQLPGALSLRVP